VIKETSRSHKVKASALRRWPSNTGL